MRDQARREADLILGEAHAEARGVQRRSIAENERLSRESRRVRAQLTGALAALDEDEPAGASEQVEHDEGERSWYGYPDGQALPDSNAA
jgi:hypothetical protein